MLSRNQREGKFVGKAAGMYRRIHADGVTPERTHYASGNCEKCDGHRVDGYCSDSGRSIHHEYGEYYWYEISTICRDCGHKSCFDDSSI